MKPSEARRTLRMLWWLQLAVAILPVWLLPADVYDLGEYVHTASFVFFALALCLLFLNNRPFHRFKHAVIAVGAARNTPNEDAAWQHLMHLRLQALWFACLPAWAGTLAKILGMELPVVILLAISTPVLFWLYRTPKQLS